MKLQNSNFEVQSIPSLLDLTEEQKVHVSQWISALRSGKYKQGAGALRNSKDEFCCLGVACDIAEIPDKTWGDLGEEVGEPYRYFQIGAKAGMMSLCHEEVREYFGFSDPRGFPIWIYHEGIQLSEQVFLTDLNDTLEATFEEIATIIEIALNGGMK